MGLSFGIHNSFGRLLDESVYQEALINSCEEAKLPCFKEVEIKVTHQTFSKSYFIDLVIGGCIYELKSTAMLSPGHKAQLLNYLLLTETNHGKLINFRGSSVESNFVSTQLSYEKRKNHDLRMDEWLVCSDYCEQIVRTLVELLNDWGTHLELSLYREAIIHFLGGEKTVCRPIDIFQSQKKVGQQPGILLNETTALHISAISKDKEAYKKHLSRLLQNTELNQLQWVNLHNRTATLSTLQK